MTKDRGCGEKRSSQFVFVSHTESQQEVSDAQVPTGAWIAGVAANEGSTTSQKCYRLG
jgi:hypothetical protein